MSEELVPWLRPKIEADLARWRDREKHFLAVREREGDYHLFEAREQAARCEAELEVLAFHDLAETWEQAAGKPQKQAEVLRIVVRQIGHGYRFRPGYRREWN